MNFEYGKFSIVLLCCMFIFTFTVMETNLFAQDFSGGDINADSSLDDDAPAVYKIDGEKVLWVSKSFCSTECPDPDNTTTCPNYCRECVACLDPNDCYNTCTDWDYRPERLEFENTYLGVGAAPNDTGGFENTFIGYNAGKEFSGLCPNRGSGHCNGSTFIGWEAGHSSLGIHSVYVGKQSGYGAMGVGNTFVGALSASTNIAGPYNTAIGFQAGTSLDYYTYETNYNFGAENTFLGNEAGKFVTSANGNVLLGINSGAGHYRSDSNGYKSITRGSFNIHLGYHTEVDDGDLTNTIAMGAYSRAMDNNQMVVGSDYMMYYKCTFDAQDALVDCEETFTCVEDANTSCSRMGQVKESYWGTGVTSSYPEDFSFNATGGTGTDASGADLILAGGKSTGSAEGGNIVFKVSEPGTAGSGQNEPTEKLRVDAYGIKVGPGEQILGEARLFTDPAMGFVFASGTGTYSDFQMMSSSGNDVLTVPAGSNNINLAPIKSGKVGIGFPFPDSKLTVSNTGNFDSFVVYDDNYPDTSPFIIDMDGNVGIGVGTPSEKLYVDGNIYATGSVTWGSSITLKENIRALRSDEAVEALKRLQPKKYFYKSDNEEEHIGFIAEEVPELLATKDRKSLDPMDIVALLTSVVKEQQKTISDLSQKVNKLEKDMTLRDSLAMSESALH